MSYYNYNFNQIPSIIMKYEFLKEGHFYYEIKFGKPDEGELFKIAVE